MYKELIQASESVEVTQEIQASEATLKQARIFSALERHFNKYDDLFKNPPSREGMVNIEKRTDL